MAEICTKSIPKRNRPSRLPKPCSTEGAQFPIHNMRSDIPNMCGEPLGNCRLGSRPLVSKYFAVHFLAINPFHADSLTRRQYQRHFLYLHRATVETKPFILRRSNAFDPEVDLHDHLLYKREVVFQ